MKHLGAPLGVLALLMGCTRALSPQSPSTFSGNPIAFPPFFEQPAMTVGASPAPYELDGTILNALQVVSSDFLGRADSKGPCMKSPEAHRYRVIRQGDVIFIRIDKDLERCGLTYISVDTGARYAIDTEGRILQRILDGEPEPPAAPPAPDAGEQDPPDTAVGQDGGTNPDVPALDAGS